MVPSCKFRNFNWNPEQQTYVYWLWKCWKRTLWRYTTSCVRFYFSSCSNVYVLFGGWVKRLISFEYRQVSDSWYIYWQQFSFPSGTPVEPTPDVIQRIRELVPIKTIYEVEVLGRTEGYEYKIRIPQISNQLKSEFSGSMWRYHGTYLSELSPYVSFHLKISYWWVCDGIMSHTYQICFPMFLFNSVLYTSLYFKNYNAGGK